LPDLTLVLLGAGNSTRFAAETKKQWLWIENEPLWLFLANKFVKLLNIKNIIIVANKQDINYMKNFADFTFVEGGQERQDSLKNALEFVKSKYVMVSDIARVCLDDNLIKRLLQKRGESDIIVPYLNATDTIHYQNRYINRDEIKIIQTPQLSKTAILKKALQNKKLFTDDSSAILDMGGNVTYVQGSSKATKLTYQEDLEKLKCLKPPSKDIFIGTGYDVHPFKEGRKMYLGGVLFDVPYGFKAHSDGDVLIHALMDALLGGIGYGDIGELYPDNDNRYKNADSKTLLKDVVKFIKSVGFEIINTDITIMAQKPKITPYKNSIKSTLAKIVKIPIQKINIKATTTEGLGFIGRSEGVAVQATVNLKYFDWMSLTGKEEV
jgi:2-C-methyl-D-erythritol 4-phosphate cytidylyltransferase/2-C-methyl-D-erythritol 2,4-cyclodiphosphate synthase